MINGNTNDFSSKGITSPDWIDNISWIQIVKGMKGISELKGFEDLYT